VKQEQREQAVVDFKTGKIPLLVATDLAGRGLHISNLDYVVNFDLPRSVEQYIHRVGRTGRQGRAGHAFTLFPPQNTQMAPALVGLLRENDQEIPIELLNLAIAHLQKVKKQPEEAVDQSEPMEEDDKDQKKEKKKKEDPSPQPTKKARFPSAHPQTQANQRKKGPKKNKHMQVGGPPEGGMGGRAPIVLPKSASKKKGGKLSRRQRKESVREKD